MDFIRFSGDTPETGAIQSQVLPETRTSATSLISCIRRARFLGFGKTQGIGRTPRFNDSTRRRQS